MAIYAHDLREISFLIKLFLACGGFPTHQLFRELGGEDGALGIATTKTAKVATLFEDVGVLHFCREGMHAGAFARWPVIWQTRSAITAEKKWQKLNKSHRPFVAVLKH